MAGRLRTLGAFAYDFVIGDDWLVAAVVVAGLGVTYWLSHVAAISAWWLIPLLLAFLLPVSLWRAIRAKR
jgi:hypothetical protein